MFHMIKRMGLYLIVNIVIVVSLNIILELSGFNYNGMGLLTFCLAIGFSGSFVSLLLSKSIAIRSTGAVEVKSGPNASESERILHEINNKIAKTMNVKPPQLYVYPSEDINAFATGPSKNNAMIALSVGLVRNMDLDEIKGVMGHEMAHIENGDMLTMTLLQGVINTFVIFAAKVIGRIAASTVKNGGFLVRILVETVLMLVFGTLAQLIMMYFSRRREYAADRDSARAVGTSTMIKALEKIKAGATLQEEMPENVAMLGISNKKKFFGLFSSHPDLDDRIKRLRVSGF